MKQDTLASRRVAKAAIELGGPIATLAAPRVAPNLVLTGGFIWCVRKLLVANDAAALALTRRPLNAKA